MPAADRRLWLRKFHAGAGPDAPKLFLFPHAGGSASSFRELSALLARDFDVVAVQYPGRQDRRKEVRATSIQELAAALLTHIGTEPVALFGHSMGAVVAFELAVLMESRGTPAVRLYASASRAPSRIVSHGVHLLDDDMLATHLGDLSGTDERVLKDEEMRGMLLGVVRGDFRALETYRATPAARLSCPVHGLVGLDDLAVTIDDVAAWGDHTRGDFVFTAFPGGHFFPFEGGAAVASMLRSDLADRRLSEDGLIQPAGEGRG